MGQFTLHYSGLHISADLLSHLWENKTSSRKILFRALKILICEHGERRRFFIKRFLRIVFLILRFSIFLTLGSRGFFRDQNTFITEKNVLGIYYNLFFYIKDTQIFKKEEQKFFNKCLKYLEIRHIKFQKVSNAMRKSN